MHEFESVADLQANAMSLAMDILIYICCYGKYIRVVYCKLQISIDFKW